MSEIVRRTGDQLFRSPLSIRVSAFIDLEPLPIGSGEVETISVTRSHENGDGTLVTIRPL